MHHYGPRTARSYRFAAASLLGGLLLVACQSGTEPSVPRAIQPTGGGQSALYGSRLPTVLQVRVVDQSGNPAAGVGVTWSSVAGAGSAEPIDAVTDADGVARSNYRLGMTPGQNIIRASVNGRDLSTDLVATGIGFSDQISVSTNQSCALDESGAAYCWGEGTNGELGDGTATNRNVPTLVSGGLRFQRVIAGGPTCGVTIDGAAYCWGYNGFGGVGDGTMTNRLVPTPVAGGLRFTSVEGGGYATCGLTTTGAAYCWGASINGQLGVDRAAVSSCTSTAATVSFPCAAVPVAVSGGPFSSITVSLYHACVLGAAGELTCWGQPSGWGTGGAQSLPVRVAADMAFAEVVAGGAHTCGIVAPASVYCWGGGVWGVLGTGGVDDVRAAPALLAGLSARHLDAGPFGTCALLTDGRASCWGFNGGGAVGDGTMTNRPVPTAAVGGESFTSIAASGDHTCGRKSNGQLLCWGNNSLGQLGSGSTEFRSLAPVLVHP